MADVINIGLNVNDGTGDDLRTAFTKVNQKFEQLDAIGGETNSGSNLGQPADGEVVFAGKVGQDLTFKRIRTADPTYLTVTTVGDSIVIDNRNVQTPAFRNVQVDNGDTITAGSDNGTFGILAGNVNISTRRVGGNVLIDGSFQVSQDSAPTLGGNLAISNNDIVGPGNITNITKLTVTGTDNLDPSTIANLDIGNQLRVSGLSTFTNTLTVNGTNLVVTNGSVVGNVTGNVTGNLIGGLGGNFNFGNYDMVGSGRFKLRRDEFTQLDTEIGDGAFYVQLDEAEDTVAFRLRTSVDDIPQPFVQIEAHSKSTLKDGFGSGVNFVIGTGDIETSRSLGSVMGRRESPTIHSVIISSDAPNLPPTELPIATFQSNNEIYLGQGDPKLKISTGASGPQIESYGQSNADLMFEAEGSGRINFYGDYQFPRNIGQAGQVLKVPTSGTVLEWGTGGGGATTTAINAIVLNNPVEITTASAHGLTDAQAVTITDVVGTTELNGNTYYVDVINSTRVDLYSDDTLSTSVNGGVMTGYLGGGFVTGSAGSGGNGTFVGLTDTPTSYAAAQGDANKLVQLNATGNGLIFTDYNSIIDATYIEGKNFMPKSGGNFTNNVTFGSGGNTITARTSDGYVLANAFVGNFVGGLSGSADGNHIGTFNGFIGNVTPSTIVGTTITANTGFVGNLTGDTTGTHNGNVNGNLTGNVNGNLVGNVTGILNGNVNAISGTSTFIGVNAGTINATGNITANSFTGDITSNGTSVLNNLNISGNIQNTLGNIELADNTDVTGNLDVTGNGIFGGSLDVGNTATIDNIKIEGNSIETLNSNENIRIASNGTGHIELEGDTRITGVLSFAKNNDQIFGTTQNPSTISATTQITFVTTSDWTSASSGLAFATLADGTREGQMKILKMTNRGRYSLDGVSFFDRHLEITLKLNGATTTLNLSQNSEFGSLVLVWHTNSWWLISELDA